MAQETFLEGGRKRSVERSTLRLVDELVIPAGSKEGTTTLNLIVFDNDGKNKLIGFSGCRPKSARFSVCVYQDR